MSPQSNNETSVCVCAPVSWLCVYMCMYACVLYALLAVRVTLLPLCTSVCVCVVRVVDVRACFLAVCVHVYVRVLYALLAVSVPLLPLCMSLYMRVCHEATLAVAKTTLIAS